MTNTIHYSAERCAAGKSYSQRERIVTTPGLHILAVDRREMIEQTIRNLRDQADKAGTTPFIRAIFSSEGKFAGGSANVRVDIEALPTIYSTGHVVIVTTHTALQISDLSKFAGWRCYIDETPSAFLRETLKTPALGSAWFAARYDLIPDPAGRAFSTVRPREGAPTNKSVRSDTAIRSLENFHSRVTAYVEADEKKGRKEADHNPVYVDLTTWDDMDTDGLEWTWHSLWLPTALSAFDRIEVVGNAFLESITYMIWLNRCGIAEDGQAPKVVFTPLPVLPARPFAVRPVEIRYFAEGHTCSTTFLDSDQGRANLARAVDYLCETDDTGQFVNVDPSAHIWMTNTKRQSSLAAIPGLMLQPQQSGSNSYASFTHATMLYSAKPSPSEISIFESMNITADQATRARETETLIQFANRIGRQADDTRKLTITVYDRRQAEDLQAYFDSVGHFSTGLVLIDLGFADVVRRKPGRPKKVKPVLTPAQLEQAAIEKREKDRIRQQKSRANRAKEAEPA